MLPIKAVLLSLIRLESARKQARGTRREGTRAKEGADTCLGPRARGKGPPQRPRALCVYVCVFGSGLFDSLSVLTSLVLRGWRSSMHESA